MDPNYKWKCSYRKLVYSNMFQPAMLVYQSSYVWFFFKRSQIFPSTWHDAATKTWSSGRISISPSESESCRQQVVGLRHQPSTHNIPVWICMTYVLPLMAYLPTLMGKGVGHQRSFFCMGIPLDRKYPYLVGGFNPSENYARQIGSSPQGSGWK